MTNDDLLSELRSLESEDDPERRGQLLLRLARAISPAEASLLHRHAQYAGPWPPERVRCLCEGVYEETLTYARVYDVVAWLPEQRKVRLVNDKGRQRSYDYHLFGGEHTEVHLIADWRLDDPVGGSLVDVRLNLQDGRRRWCMFTTPTHLSGCGELYGDGVRWHEPCAHLFVVTHISEGIIEEVLRTMERQGKLLEHTASVDWERDVRPRPSDIFPVMMSMRVNLIDAEME